MSGFTSNTLLIRIQYCHQFEYFTDLIKVKRRMVKLMWNEMYNVSYGIAKCIREIVTKGKCNVLLFNDYWIDLRSDETFVQ